MRETSVELVDLWLITTEYDKLTVKYIRANCQIFSGGLKVFSFANGRLKVVYYEFMLLLFSKKKTWIDLEKKDNKFYPRAACIGHHFVWLWCIVVMRRALSQKKKYRITFWYSYNFKWRIHRRVTEKKAYIGESAC